MHIVDGVLSAPVLIGGTALAIGGLAVGLRRLGPELIPRTALLSAAFFVASLVHVPVGPANAHLALLGLMGVLLGWSVFPALLVGLLLQALFFGYGGISVLGVNLLNLALPALLTGWLLRPWLRRTDTRLIALYAFLAGALATAGAALMVAASMALSGREFIPAATLVLVSHVPLMVVEGAVTAAAITLLRRVKPDSLGIPEAATANGVA